MWKRGRQSISAGDDSTNVIAGRDVNIILENRVPTELVNQKIEEEVGKLRKSRFFSEFNRARSSLSLGRRLANGELSGGTDEMRCLGLAWCARVLSPSDEIESAESFLEVSKTLGDSPEVKVAEAFIISQKGDKSSALQALAEIGSYARVLPA